MDILVVNLVLYILAATCFFLFSVGHVHARVNFLGLGVFFWSLVPLIATLQKL